MPEVDPVTGLPRFTADHKVESDRISKLEDQKGQSQRMLEDISSEKGQVIMNLVKEHFLARVNILIDQDEECRAYKKLFLGIGSAVNMGELAVERLSRLTLKRQTR